MDRNKRAFVAIVGVLAWCVYDGVKAHMLRIDRMEEKLDIVDKTQDNLLQLMNDATQPMFDEQFEEIIERYDE